MRRQKKLMAALAGAFVAQQTDPDHLIRIVGETLKAQSCELVFGSRRYEWSAAGYESAERVRCTLNTDPEIIIAIAPESAMLSVQEWQPLLVLLEPLAYAAATERAQRRRNTAVRRLDDARWRASVEMAQERRRLERDLHDGAQHHLVALQMAIALAEHHDGDSVHEQRREDVLAQLESVEQVLVATARGVLPRSLAVEGLNGALLALIAPNVTVHADLPRLMPAVESALYFIALEAVSNAQKHAAGSQITIDAKMRGAEVTISICDDGPGFIVDDDGLGGLSHLAHRLEAINGAVDVRSSPGSGTCVIASVRY